MNTTRQGLLCLFALLFLLPPAGLCQDAAATKRTAEEDIREAVIRKQMEDWYRNADKSEAAAKGTTGEATAKKMNFKIFFVSMDGKDPSDGFIKRLQNIPRTIKKVSSSRIDRHRRMAVVDRSTGQRGIRFRADAIRWLSKDHVEVEGGYHRDGRCGAGVSFELRLENGKWVVKGERMTWIS